MVLINSNWLWGRKVLRVSYRNLVSVSWMEGRSRMVLALGREQYRFGTFRQRGILGMGECSLVCCLCTMCSSIKRKEGSIVVWMVWQTLVLWLIVNWPRDFISRRRGARACPAPG